MTLQGNSTASKNFVSLITDLKSRLKWMQPQLTANIRLSFFAEISEEFEANLQQIETPMNFLRKSG